MILTEDKVKDLLNKFGIPTPRHVLIGDERSIAHLAITFPVALKVCSPDIWHKTEVGGVRLGIEDKPSLLHAVREMRVLFPEQPLMVETMEQPGLEIIVGLANDRTFGLCILVGLGGIFAEVLNDVSFRVLPINHTDADRMLQELEARQVLEGFRGRKVDRRGLIDLMVAVSRMGVELGETLDQLDLNPVIVREDSVSVVDAKLMKREYGVGLSTRRIFDPLELRPILYPRSIAVVGASVNTEKIGGRILKNLIDGGFPGHLYAVNPKAEPIQGIPAQKSVLEIDAEIDLAMIAVPVGTVPQVVKECGAKGVQGLAILTAGYEETGHEGQALGKQLRSLLDEYEMRVVGPNLMGVLNLNCGLMGAFAVETLIPRLVKGGIGLIAQSGSVGSALLQNATNDGIGVALYLPLGNRTDTDEADWIRFMDDDPTVTVIAAHLESIKSGDRFLEAIRTLTKPLVIFKTGHTKAGEKAAASHSAAMATNHNVLTGVLRQYGILQATTSEEFYDVVKTLACWHPFSAEKLLAIETTGGLGVIASDHAQLAGLELPDLDEPIKKQLGSILLPHAIISNPLDTVALDATTFERIAQLEVMDTYDALLLIFGDPVIEASRAVRAFQETTDKPIVVAFSGGGAVEELEREKITELGIPVFPSVERAMTYFRLSAGISMCTWASSHRARP